MPRFDCHQRRARWAGSALRLLREPGGHEAATSWAEAKEAVRRGLQGRPLGSAGGLFLALALVCPWFSTQPSILALTSKGRGWGEGNIKIFEGFLTDFQRIFKMLFKDVFKRCLKDF